RLSSGRRILTPADDPAGFVIANQMEVQADSLQQALTSVQNSASMVKTASSALSQISSLLRSIRTSVLSASASLASNPAQAAAEQQAIQQAIQSIHNIAATTQFGNKNLLDGTAGVSASVTNSAVIEGITFGGTFAGGVTQAGNVTITVVNAATRAQASGAGLATYASVNASLSTVNGGTSGNGGTFTINGQSITVSGSDTVQTLINRINEISATTGVSAQAVTANGSTAIQLVQSRFGANYRIVTSESSPLVLGTAGTNVAGTNATVTVTAPTLINGAISYATVTFVGGRYSTDTGLRVSDVYGNSILLTEAGNTTGTSNAGVGSITASAVSFQIGPGAGQTASLTFPAVFPSRLGASAVAGQNLSTIDVTTSTGVSNALLVVDEAIQQVARYAAQLGGFEKHVLQASTSAMSNTLSSLQSTISRIQDVDIAEETTRLGRLQTLQQAALLLLRNTQDSTSFYLKLLQ
ncbi:MAG: flagellin, partial [Chloroherpetonaceae bacterium]|nr:flagellin [Chthonomonadaceae bacterium]MDW8208694.1 flagellin [Chloroherpetonaceae bacterium]